MKIKQLEALRQQDAKYRKNESIEKPSKDEFIKRDILSGRTVTFVSRAKLTDLIKAKIFDRYSSISPDSLVETTPSFSTAMSEYNAKAKAFDLKVQKYAAVADKLLRKAELDDKADPMEIGEALAEAAYEAGLIS